jgi:hypothetical protein
MRSVRFDCPVEGLPGVRVDALSDDTAFEVLVEPRDVRRLRAALMDIARIVATGSVCHGVLVLEEPHITERRIRDEWEGAASVMRPELFDRLALAVHRSGEWTGTPYPPDARDLEILNEIIRNQLARQPVPSGRGSEAYYEILRILIHHWLLGKGAIAINRLMEISGNSYPTVSKSLHRLDYCLQRHSDRSVELRYFPRDEWARLLAVSDEVRATARFIDPSGQPRSPGSLLRRLRKLQRGDVAVGGVRGAKHYQPSLDLIGETRLDLSVHAVEKAGDLSFVERLDPALERVTRRDQTPVLVVHQIRRAESLFQAGEDGLPWADPVECLLDLQEARLEPQAREFLQSFPTTTGKPLGAKLAR